MNRLEDFNHLAPDEARRQLSLCCVAHRWTSGMALRRPFSSLKAVLVAADSVWVGLRDEDYLEAFEGHAKIGDSSSLKSQPNASKAWGEEEQSGVNVASDDVINELARLNAKYERLFGFIFIVCATGKSARDMLEMLKLRIVNSRRQEITNAATEQSSITKNRLVKILTD